MIQRIIVLLCATLALLQIQELMASEVGDVAPNCTIMPGSNSKHYELQQLQGKVVYVDFWASWCGPCAKSFPFLNDLDHEFRDLGLEIVGVNMDEKPEDMQEFIAQYPANFAVALPPNQQCALDFGVKAMPSSYIIDRKGNIRLVHLGFRAGEAEELRELIKQLLAESAAGN